MRNKFIRLTNVIDDPNVPDRALWVNADHIILFRPLPKDDAGTMTNERTQVILTDHPFCNVLSVEESVLRIAQELM